MGQWTWKKIYSKLEQELELLVVCHVAANLPSETLRVIGKCLYQGEGHLPLGAPKVPCWVHIKCGHSMKSQHKK